MKFVILPYLIVLIEQKVNSYGSVRSYFSLQTRCRKHGTVQYAKQSLHRNDKKTRELMAVLLNCVVTFIRYPFNFNAAIMDVVQLVQTMRGCGRMLQFYADGHGP
jgi:hypothetical protein